MGVPVSGKADGGEFRDGGHTWGIGGMGGFFRGGGVFPGRGRPGCAPSALRRWVPSCFIASIAASSRGSRRGGGRRPSLKV